MRTIRLIRVNLKKAMTSYGFFACIILTSILLFTSPLYYDYEKNTYVSIIQSFFKFRHDEMLSDTNYCSYNVLQKCVSGWLKMFIPMIASFPFVSMQCTERATGVARFSGIRLSKQSYQTGTFISSMIIGGVILTIGFCLFWIFTSLVFPNISEYPPELKGLFEKRFLSTHPYYNTFGYTYLIILRFIEMFLYGAVSAVPACFMTCLVNNKYLVISIPFFLKYMLLQHLNRLQTEAFENINNIDKSRISFLNMIDPDLICRTFSGDDDIWKNILFYSFVIVFTFIIYSTILNRRQDYGT